MTHPFGFDYVVSIASDQQVDQQYLSLLSVGNVAEGHIDKDGITALDGFGDIVYPFLHATTSGSTDGWCSPDFKHRCSDAKPCANGTCAKVPGLGLGNTFPGLLIVETDHDLIPDSYQPKDGDRVATFGRWIVDCGHGDDDGHFGFHTEIHPPLLLASARATGPGLVAGNCSGEQTCSTVIGRPFLVGQGFGDGFLAKHVAHEVEKLGCDAVMCPLVSAGVTIAGLAGLPDCGACDIGGDACVACEVASCAGLGIGIGAPLGSPCSTQIDAHPQVFTTPFAGQQDMQYYVTPANPRLHPGDRMLAKWHLTAREGVTVALSDAGDAGLLVDVALDHDTYAAATPPPALPPRMDWTVERLQLSSFESVGRIFATLLSDFAPVQKVIIDRGVLTDRFMAPQVPSNAGVAGVSFVDQASTVAQPADIDNGQPFPVSGWINVGWFRCDAGGSYSANCAGPRTSITLNGSGSDPDGNPLTFTWTGPFVGGTATGATPTVRFNGSGTFPVTLTLSNGTISTSCTASVTVKPAAVFQLGGGKADVTGSAGGINGDVCIGPNGGLNVTGSQFVTGTIHLAPGATLNKSGTGVIGPVLQNQDLSARITDTLAAATDFAALPCTQSFARWGASTVVVGAGGQNVICVGDVALHSGQVVTLSGGANDTFIVNVTGRFELSSAGKIVASGVPPSAIVYNVIGGGRQVQLSGADGGVACCRTSVDGTVLAVGRTIALAPGLVSGGVIGGQNIGLTGGGSVH